VGFDLPRTTSIIVLLHKIETQRTTIQSWKSCSWSKRRGGESCFPWKVKTHM